LKNDAALAATIDRWKPEKALAATFRGDVTVRRCDFDPLGHVNNACYFDYLDTVLAGQPEGQAPVRHLRIEFQKEISRRTAAVTVELARISSGFGFQLTSGGRRHAAGEAVFGEDALG
jgi:medium-chain acyl-[acyl-carrier-protein] hydrolase